MNLKNSDPTAPAPLVGTDMGSSCPITGKVLEIVATNVVDDLWQFKISGFFKAK